MTQLREESAWERKGLRRTRKEETTIEMKKRGVGVYKTDKEEDGV